MRISHPGQMWCAEFKFGMKMLQPESGLSISRSGFRPPLQEPRFREFRPELKSSRASDYMRRDTVLEHTWCVPKHNRLALVPPSCRDVQSDTSPRRTGSRVSNRGPVRIRRTSAYGAACRQMASPPVRGPAAGRKLLHSPISSGISSDTPLVHWRTLIQQSKLLRKNLKTSILPIKRLAHP